MQVFPVSKSGIDAMHGGLMVIRDVTDKRMSEQLKADFFANAGHELKTPLTAISGFAELLETDLCLRIRRIITSENSYRGQENVNNHQRHS